VMLHVPANACARPAALTDETSAISAHVKTRNFMEKNGS
jgi:hypothetical protein